ncbi:hypothetical protein P280DRAFT_412255 [Massarina eburnea CBS 473.64]|uniref:Uncharacterized protein n=1 Tax=Massarina eburnea CBS 473.64 TaxID=1395130 RepID=A0A6A6RIG0_9PLEO|nr:hypothetical protein P280DRAFT_412255 [Massarina eburnea CBS 473.64]
MSTASSSTDTALLISFGILTLLATIAGLHYRDSLFCLLCRSLHHAWTVSKWTCFRRNCFRVSC